MKKYLLVVITSLILTMSFVWPSNARQFTSSQCLLWLGEHARSYALLRDTGVSLASALAVQKKFALDNNYALDSEDVRISMDIIRYVYSVPKRSPDQVLEDVTNNCLDKKGLIIPSRDV